MKRFVVAGVLCLSLFALTNGVARANLGPPSVPNPPPCKSCSGPPPPPTATPTATVVPTLAPTQVPVEAVVQVHFSLKKISRGHTAKVSIDASTDDSVTLTVHYHKGKAQVFHGKIGSSGTFSKKWKIPSTAALGKAKLNVSVDNHEAKYSKTLTFTVT